jgi:hypothetical protein
VEYVQRQLFGGFPVVGELHHQREYEAMRAFVQVTQRESIGSRDGLHERHPVVLGNTRLRLIGIKQRAEGSRGGIMFVGIVVGVVRRAIRPLFGPRYTNEIREHAPRLLDRRVFGAPLAMHVGQREQFHLSVGQQAVPTTIGSRIHLDGDVLEVTVYRLLDLFQRSRPGGRSRF